MRVRNGPKSGNLGPYPQFFFSDSESYDIQPTYIRVWWNSVENFQLGQTSLKNVQFRNFDLALSFSQILRGVFKEYLKVFLDFNLKFSNYLFFLNVTDKMININMK